MIKMREFNMDAPGKKDQTKTELDHRKFSTDNGNSQLYIDDESIHMSSGGSVVAVTPKFSMIRNPLHHAMEPSQFRLNYYWVLNEEILTTLPSSIYTPIPMLRYSEPPYAREIADLVKKLANI